MCMTLSGYTSTLPRLVVQCHGFEASFLIWAKLEKLDQNRRVLTEAMICAGGAVVGGVTITTETTDTSSTTGPDCGVGEVGGVCPTGTCDSADDMANPDCAACVACHSGSAQASKFRHVSHSTLKPEPRQCQ